MFATPEDLKNTIYEYQVDQITDGDESIVLQALMAAESEVKSYLMGNDKKEWLDGRPRYDVERIFSQTGTDRNPLILAQVLTIAKWRIAELCNVDFIYEKARERYDRAVDWLKMLAQGTINLAELPALSAEIDAASPAANPWSYGSRLKFNHE